MVIEQNRLTKKYLAESNTINGHLIENKELSLQQAQLSFKTEEDKVAIAIDESQFYFCKSADNYIELFYESDGEIKKELFRNSLKNLETDFAQNANIERVHRSYLVNLEKVKSVDGNARGLKLKLHTKLPEIPISRSKHDMVLALLDSH